MSKSKFVTCESLVNKWISNWNGRPGKFESPKTLTSQWALPWGLCYSSISVEETERLALITFALFMLWIWFKCIRLCERFRIDHKQHDNDIHLEVHEPAFSMHFYGRTSDHQVGFRMQKCSEPEHVPQCCYLAFAYAAAPANLTCISAVLFLFPRQLVHSFQMPGKRCIFLSQQSRSCTRSHYVMKLRIFPAHTKIFNRSAFHFYVKFRAVSSAEIDYSVLVLSRIQYVYMCEKWKTLLYSE